MLDKTILVIDDDEDFCIALCEVLEHEGYRARRAATAGAAMAVLDEGPPAACLLDWHIAGDPIEIANRLHAAHIPVILASGDNDSAENAERIGATAVLDKPFDLNDLMNLLARLVPGDRHATVHS